MKNLFTLLTIIIYGLIANAKPEMQMLEIGEEYQFNQVKEKIWIENPKIFSAKQINQSIIVKPLAIGSAKIKVDKQEYTFMSLPFGFKESYKFWSKYVRKSPNLTVKTCADTICISGEIFSFAEFEKIIVLMQEKQSYIFLKLNAPDEVKNQIQIWYRNYFRTHELTPPKIVFSEDNFNLPWKAIITAKEDNSLSQKIAHRVGLFTQENRNKLDIADNIKVAVKFIEVKKSFIRGLGINWPNIYNGEFNGSELSLEKNINLILNAAENTGDSKIIASPNLICRNGKEAEFLAGGELPIKFSNGKSREVIWKKFGIQLKIKPTIDPQGQMSIEIQTEVSTPDFSQSVDGIPSLNTNKVSSHFDLTKSRTIVLSGLIQNGISTQKSGLPFLTQIPMLGKLFSSQLFQENQSELIILVTPEIDQ